MKYIDNSVRVMGIEVRLDCILYLLFKWRTDFCLIITGIILSYHNKQTNKIKH
jgi:hypothetical protein